MTTTELFDILCALGRHLDAYLDDLAFHERPIYLLNMRLILTELQDRVAEEHVMPRVAIEAERHLS